MRNISLTSVGNQDKNGKRFRLATFNVRGLTQQVKQEQLSRDMKKYKIDVACIQETKIKESMDKDISGYRIMCTETTSQHYGNGFIVSPRWKKHIHRYWRVSDRISVLQLKTEKSKMAKNDGNEYASRSIGGCKLLLTTTHPTDHLVNIINVYLPTSEKVANDETEAENIYTEIENLMNVFKKYKSSVTFIAGDFNAKVGKRNGEEESIGRYSIGERNRSGELMVNFCDRNELFMANTAFQHPAKHISTWSQQRVNKENNTVKRIFNQIDFILVKKNMKHNLQDARTYAGTEVFSDHKLLVMVFENDIMKMFKKINKKKEKTQRRFNTRKLLTDHEARDEYQQKLEAEAADTKTWEELGELCKKTAEEVIGYREKEESQATDDDDVKRLSLEQKEIRTKMMNEKKAEKVEQMRVERREKQRQIKQKLKEIREEEIDAIADEIEKVKDDARMFKAMKKVDRKSFENPIVHDKENKNVTDPQQIYEIVTDHFKKQFYDENAELIERFAGEARRLNRPITKEEVIKAVKKMANGKAAGKDNISVELLKYAPEIVFEKIATFLNELFEKHKDINTGTSELVPLQKPPPKKKGPVKNLRPINLLLVIRKVLSKIALNRSSKPIGTHLSFSQSAYTEGRATTDIVWAYRWIIAKTQEYKITIYVTGIDMSSAFDTINRKKLLEIAERILDEDGQRMLRILLSDTTVEIRIKGAETKPFTTNIGSPQGDSYSGPQFTMYFEEALEGVRDEINMVVELCLPQEMIYADDYDHLTEDHEKKEQFKSCVKEILGKDNLKVNEDKTEDTVLKRGKHDRKNKNKNEPWRETIKLGSKLGDEEDIKRRKNLATGKLAQMKKVLKSRKISKVKKKMKLYNAMVKSVLTYNACTWGLTKSDEKNLNSFHRKQLRQVLGIYYPHKISNENLYKITNSRPITIDITKARWKMFGHALRLNEQTPARKAMKYYFQHPQNCERFRGRKRATIVTTLNRDIIRTKTMNNQFYISELKSELDLRNTRVKATNRNHWIKIVKMVTDAAYSDSA